MPTDPPARGVSPYCFRSLMEESYCLHTPPLPPISQMSRAMEARLTACMVTKGDLVLLREEIGLDRTKH